MEHFDSEKAARVWKRVNGNGAETGESVGIQHLAAEEMRLAMAYRQIARQLSTGTAERMAKDCMECYAILQGMRLLSEGKAESNLPVPATQEPLRVRLTKCYASTLKQLAAYERRTGDPEYGYVFQKLAEKKRDQSWRLLMLLGSQK